jgi:hypothetical protein
MRSVQYRPWGCAALLLALFAAASLRAQQAEEVFPAQKGTYWLYRGEATWENGPGRQSTTKIEWKMEVLDSLDRPGFAAILLKGHPSDLAWYTPDTKPQESLLVQIGMRFYFTRGEGVRPLWQSLQQTEFVDRAKTLVDDADIWLSLPTKKGDKFCDPELPRRDDSMYCWYVEEVVPADLATVKGATARSLREFKLSFRTNPDDEEMGFAPGIGIVSYDYNHHGTAAESHVKLVEFGREPPVSEQH